MVELGDLREGILPADVAAWSRAALAPPEHRAARHRHQPRVPERGGARRHATWRSCRPGRARSSDASTSRSTSCRAATRPTSAGRSDRGDVGPDQRPAPGRVDPARPGTVAPHADRRACAPTPSRLVAEVIEAKVKPSRPGATIGQAAFGQPRRSGVPDRGAVDRVIVAIGRQDVDPAGLVAPARHARCSAPAATTWCSTPVTRIAGWAREVALRAGLLRPGAGDDVAVRGVAARHPADLPRPRRRPGCDRRGRCPWADGRG